MRKLAIFTAGFALSAVLYVYFFPGAWVLWIAAVCLLVSLACRYIGFRRVCVAALGVAIGAVWVFSYDTIWLEPPSAVDNSVSEIEAYVTRLPYETNYGMAVQCELDGYEAVLYGNKELKKVEPGDVIHCIAEITMEKDLYDRASGRVFSLRANGDIRVEDGEPNLFAQISMWLQHKIDILYDGESAGLVKALLTGDRSDLSYQTTNAMSVSGISHAIAVSGMHVSILLTMVAMVCAYHPRLTAVIGIPTIIIFVIVTGASPSVCRAAVMQTMLLCAPLAKRERDNVTSLAAAAFVLLIQNPWCVASISFQLSFAAVAGLMLFSDKIRVRILQLSEKPGKLLKFFAAGVSATLSATLLTMPLTAIYFDTVSIVSPLVNVLSLWAVTGVFTLGLVSCCIGSVVPFVVWGVQLLSEYIIGISELAASFPYAAAFDDNSMLMIWAMAAYVLFVAILCCRRLPARWLMSVLTVGFLVCILSAHMRFTTGPWRMTVLDVGQGQCIVLRIDDYTAVVDCGGSNSRLAGEQGARYLHSAGITHIDAMILTHFDGDHAGGATHFLDRVTVDRIYLPQVEDKKGIARELTQIHDDVQYVSAHMKIEIGTGKIELFPPVTPADEANSGLCILASADECDILITGDLNEEAEARVLAQWSLPDVEILVAGHHGAKTSTSNELLAAVKPEIAAVSVGRNNRYGHPHEDTLRRLETFGVQIYRTDILGDIYFSP